MTTKIISKTIALQNENSLSYIFLKNGDWKPKNNDGDSVLQSASDRQVFNKIIALIQSAKEMICLQSFLIQDNQIIDKLLSASERGVKVYITSSANVRLEPKMYADIEPDFIKENYIKMLNEKFKSNFIFRSADNFHAKFIIIDGKSEAKGMIFTNNFTDKGFFENPELAIILSENKAKELFKVFVYHFWEQATDEQNTTNEFEKVKPLQKFQFPVLKEILVTSTEKKSLKESFLYAIYNAENEITFSTFDFDPDYETGKAIAEKQKQGVKIKIFAKLRDKKLNEQLKNLLDNGAEIYCHELTHAKFLCVDNKKAFVFTANFDTKSLETGFNVGLQLDEKQTIELQNIIQNWKNIFSFKWIKSKKIQELTEYYILENSKITLKIIKNESEKIEKRNIKNIQELFDFFQKDRKNENNTTKSEKIILEAEIEIKQKTNDFIEKEAFFVNEKQKEIILKSSFDFDNNFESLKNYQNFKCLIL